MKWHLISKDGLPKKSGKYLISRYGVLWTKDKEQTFISPAFRYVETALYVRDVKKFDTQFPTSIYAWAKLPKPAAD